MHHGTEYAAHALRYGIFRIENIVAHEMIAEDQQVLFSRDFQTAIHSPIINWGKYRGEGGRLLMPVSVRMNHAVADGYLIANVFRLLE